MSNRGREDARLDEERSDRKNRGCNVISFDYCFTTVQGEPDEKQYATALYVADSETKAVLCLPVAAKGSVSLRQATEELLRVSLAVTGASQKVIFQADSERSTRQLLRALQHARAQLGLQCDTRVTGVGQHASNGQAENCVKTVRRLANTLRSAAEERCGVKIAGSCHAYPWSFRHAAWLITRFRVINGATSFETTTGRQYQGKVVLWGVKVLFRDVAAVTH